MNKLTNLKHYSYANVKGLYGRYGKKSGIRPGVIWPRKEELNHLKQYEAAFCPKLDDLIAECEMKKQQSIEYRETRKQQVLRDLKKLPGEFEKFFKVFEEKKREQEKWTEEREVLIEQVRDILGYRAKPSDPKFQEALAQKEAEDLRMKKKAARKEREMAGLEEVLASAKKS